MGNKELNSLKEYRGRCCRNCGRTPDDTLLDIISYLEKGGYLVCVDVISCNTFRARNPRLRK